MARKLSRRDLARYIAKELADGRKPEVLARQLAAYLIDHHRTNEQAVIIRDIATHLADYGHVTGNLTAASQLSDATIKQIEDYAKRQTGAKHVSLDAEVDAGVLGGIRLELPGAELDTTIARQLTVLTTRYKKA